MFVVHKSRHMKLIKAEFLNHIDQIVLCDTVGKFRKKLSTFVILGNLHSIISYNIKWWTEHKLGIQFTYDLYNDVIIMVIHLFLYTKCVQTHITGKI